MHSNLNLNNSRGNSRVGLYAFVFASKISLIVVVFLFFSFSIQPVHLAYANEAEAVAEAAEAAEFAEKVVPHEAVEKDLEVVEEVITEEVAVETATESPAAEDVETVTDDGSVDAVSNEEIDIDVDVMSPDAQISDISSSTDESVAATSEETTASTTAPISDSTDSEATASTTDTANIPDDSTASSTDESSDTASSTDESVDATGVASSSSSSNSGNEASSDEGSGSDANSNTNTSDSSPSDGSNVSDENDTAAPVDPADTAAETAGSEITTATSAPTAENVSKVQTIVTDDNFYQFGKQACVSVGEGSYHCSVTDGDIVGSQAVVYSEVGPSGSPEIFIQTSLGEVKQVTDNNFEDSSPHYDAESQKIAWQRLIQGRYQIVIYDIDTGKEKQLTFSRTNNMEPAVTIDGVVWQAWDNNDWEIMYYDGTYTDQLTSNNVQDLAPVMEDDYIIWTVIGGGSQYAQVYSFDTKEAVTINNHEGGSIVNPRFVLVYDTKFDNGDVITQRFDPETGFAEAIAAQPAEAPLEIPDADSTLEIKALIQTKSTSKQTVVIDTDGNNSTGGATGTSDTLNLFEPDSDLTQETVSTSTDGVIDADEEIGNDDYLELNEYDLILPPTQPVEATISVSVSNASST
ncbi:MAG: hypothetical protein LR008_00885 [Candidatus Pacebacteria bacterium]|nr:hypothetical protein [Candidatus Paceibacterota bacterium]